MQTVSNHFETILNQATQGNSKVVLSSKKKKRKYIFQQTRLKNFHHSYIYTTTLHFLNLWHLWNLQNNSKPIPTISYEEHLIPTKRRPKIIPHTLTIVRFTATDHSIILWRTPNANKPWTQKINPLAYITHTFHIFKSMAPVRYTTQHQTTQ